MPIVTRLVMALALVFAIALPASADEAGIRATITGQMEAFRAEDAEGAFSYAAPNIKGMFGSADRFGMMVRNGYPMVWNNVDVQYLELRELGGRLWQMVQVQDTDGGYHYLDYLMVETPDGWQIAAVQFLPAPDIGV
ncbi:MAG: DUF4864 domain-containing protein [Pseudomonadota bacterium]